MKLGVCLAALCIIGYCIQPISSSYLNFPRINFHGQFRADSNTHNNDVCNYRGGRIPEDRYVDWNSDGTNEFEFVNAKVSSVIDRSGNVVTTDPVVGRSIVGNLEGPLAKLSDGTTRDPEIFTVYGMQFGIKWLEEEKFPIKNRKEDLAFHGKIAPYIVTQSMWRRIPCYNSTNSGENPYQGSIRAGTQFSSTLSVDFWGDTKESGVLKELKESVPTGKKLSVRISLFYTTRRYLPYLPYNASLGYFVGSIGIQDDFPAEPREGVTYDTANIPGKRVLTRGADLDTPANLKFTADDDICRGLKTSDLENEKWVNTAPFEVFKRDTGKHEVQLDLSNSIPTDLKNTLRDMGKLHLAVHDRSKNCVRIISDPIDYNSDHQLYKMGGIHRVTLHDSASKYYNDFSTVLLSLVQVGKHGKRRLCDSSWIQLNKAQVLLEEEEYFIRPMTYYNDHLEKGHKTESEQVVYVTSYGKPVSGVTVSVQYTQTDDSGPPKDAVAPATKTDTTDSNGIAKFTFKRSSSIAVPMYRQYDNPSDCLKGTSYYLPIDGQLYHFIYCIGEVCNKDIISYFLAFGDYTIPEDPSWIENVHPILSQYAQLSPMMTKILDMSNYTEVVMSTQMMEMSLCNTDLLDPAYMPTTRDLSDEKRKMIILWLTPRSELGCTPQECTVKEICDAKKIPSVGNPKFDSTDSTRTPVPLAPECPNPPDKIDLLKYQKLPSPEDIQLKCKEEAKFGHPPLTSKLLLQTLIEFNHKVDEMSACPADAEGMAECAMAEQDWTEFQMRHSLADIHLPDYLAQVEGDCSVPNLKKNLQEAIYLEWATIPVYLTSLYSVIEGCNHEIYELIQAVVREEMLHMTQVANTLIAMDVDPQIDNNIVSKAIFEKGRLPGKVLPTLKVTLEKLSLEHVRRLFMTIEVPQSRTSLVRLTIGWFYNKIMKCIDKLHGEGKLQDSDFQHRRGQQVRWPRTNNAAVDVNSISSAKDGFKMIIEQGEGADFIVEHQVESGIYPHFYTFEEIVCQKRLKKVGNKYSYTGDDLPFNENGVWPMRSNPTIASIPKDSNCYIESRAFHKVYRLLLSKLHELFNGANTEKNLFVSLQLMESLQAHAKRLMMTKKMPDCTAACETCEECGDCAHACKKCDACLSCGPVWEYDWPTAEPADD